MNHNTFQQLDITRQTEKDRKFAEKLQELELNQPKTDESRELSQIIIITKFLISKHCKKRLF